MHIISTLLSSAYFIRFSVAPFECCMLICAHFSYNIVFHVLVVCVFGLSILCSSYTFEDGFHAWAIPVQTGVVSVYFCVPVLVVVHPTVYTFIVLCSCFIFLQVMIVCA